MLKTSLTILPILAFTTITTAEAAGDEAVMYRHPDVGKDAIVFIYGNDIWMAPKTGGVATPLASPAGMEMMPKFSPDSSEIAFVGNYEGDRDIYTIPVEGGIAHRVTHHPANENFTDWTQDGDLIFSAGAMGGVPRAQSLFTVNKEGGLPQKLPVPYGVNGTISADGRWLAYSPHSRDSRTWKRYRGGMQTDIWLMDLETGESRRVTDWEGTDTLPMWHGDTLYYLSDRGDNHRLNIWSFDPGSGRHNQLTRYANFDVKWPSIGPEGDGAGEIIYQNGSQLYLMDLASKQSTPINVTIPGGKPALRDRMENAGQLIQSWDISPNAKRAVVEARGDIWTLPAENGTPRNLTRTSGVAERLPAWSPDGKWIAYYSDQTGEYELYVRPSNGKGEARQLTDDGGPYKFSTWWTPDSEAILYGDKSGTLRHIDVESGEQKEIMTDPWGPTRGVSFSKDGNWIAFARGGDDKMFSSIWLYDMVNDEAHQVTSSMFNDESPAFDREGDYLYFTSNRTFTPNYSEIDGTWIYDDSGILVAVPLRTDVDNPWLAESDEEEWEEDEEEESEVPTTDEEDAKDEADEDQDEAPTHSDPVSGTWNCVAQVEQMGELPFQLILVLADDNSVTGTFSTEFFDTDVSGTWNPGSSTLTMTATMPGGGGGDSVEMTIEISGEQLSGTGTSSNGDAEITGSREAPVAGENEGDDTDGDKKSKKDAEEEPMVIEIEGFEQRAFKLPVPSGSFSNLAVNDKNQLLYVRRGSGGGIKMYDLGSDDRNEKSVTGGGGFIMTPDGKKMLVPRGGGAGIAKAGAGGSPKNVVNSPMDVSVSPREEWRQLFTDAWRIQRDFFYDPGLHQVDWDMVYEQYLPMIDAATSREDVSYIIGEMISELNVGHAYYSGGDTEPQPSVSSGMLGVDFEMDNGAYRISRIVQGAPWDLDARNPLNAQGVQVDEGDYLLAVNGIPMDMSKDPWAPFANLAGKTITLTVSEKPEMDDDAREVVIKTIRSERNLRYRDWIESKRAYVDEMTDGQVGYIYVPNTGVDGQNDLVRQFSSQFEKPALIIDERWNGGGQIPDRFIEMLNRPRTNYWARRDGKDWSWPMVSHQGPKCMLINGLAGSGGDMFPWLFKEAELGPLVGTRTWGGLVGISGNPRLVDGGYTSVPTFGFYETDGTWGIEGHGVDPDYEVIDDPALMIDGGDPQLDKAIELMVEALKTERYVPATRPDSPDRSGMGITEEDK